jgi:hypothetical protein
MKGASSGESYNFPSFEQQYEEAWDELREFFLSSCFCIPNYRFMARL